MSGSFRSGPFKRPIKTDANGNILATVIPRTGTEASLMSVVGDDGEVGVPIGVGEVGVVTYRGGKATVTKPHTNIAHVTVHQQVVAPNYELIVQDNVSSMTVNLLAGKEDGQMISLFSSFGWFGINGAVMRDGITSALSNPAGAVGNYIWSATIAKWVKTGEYLATAPGKKYLNAASVDGTSMSIGDSSIASTNSVAIGDDANASTNSVAIGKHIVSGVRAVGVGDNVQAHGNLVVIGRDISDYEAGTQPGVVIANFNSQYKKNIGHSPSAALNCNPQVPRCFGWGAPEVHSMGIEQILGVVTANATPTSLTTDGAAVAVDAANVFNLWDAAQEDTLTISDMAYAVRISILARKNGTGEAAFFVRECAVVVKNSVPYVTQLIGPVVATISQHTAGLAGLAVAIAVATAPGASGVEFLDIKATGLASNSITWRAKFDVLGAA